MSQFIAVVHSQKPKCTLKINSAHYASDKRCADFSLKNAPKVFDDQALPGPAGGAYIALPDRLAVGKWDRKDRRGTNIGGQRGQRRRRDKKVQGGGKRRAEKKGRKGNKRRDGRGKGNGRGTEIWLPGSLIKVGASEPHNTNTIKDTVWINATNDAKRTAE